MTNLLNNTWSSARTEVRQNNRQRSKITTCLSRLRVFLFLCKLRKLFNYVTEMTYWRSDQTERIWKMLNNRKSLFFLQTVFRLRGLLKFLTAWNVSSDVKQDHGFTFASHSKGRLLEDHQRKTYDSLIIIAFFFVSWNNSNYLILKLQ